ncbi:MAG: hypothetical protein KF791_15720 [Verrucomicrobiae bacterium]|nr:hypothetical protein [Verrucomicrobiae bacterium]
MSEPEARLRQELWRIYQSMARTLRTLQLQGPMVQGSLYLLRRKCGKPSCRCARGELHPCWVLSRSESGKSRLYPVPFDQRGRLRPLTREYRRWQLARARLVRQSGDLVALIDQLAEPRLRPWPAPSPDEPGTG